MLIKLGKVNTMSKVNSQYIQDCLKGKNCLDCKVCNAEIDAWNQLESDIAETGKNFMEDLQTYYQVKGKRRIFEQKEHGEYLTLSEPETLGMLSRY